MLSFCTDLSNLAEVEAKGELGFSILLSRITIEFDVALLAPFLEINIMVHVRVQVLDGGEQIEKRRRRDSKLRRVWSEFFLLTNGMEVEIADSKVVASKPCYEQVFISDEANRSHG